MQRYMLWYICCAGGAAHGADGLILLLLLLGQDRAQVGECVCPFCMTICMSNNCLFGLFCLCLVRLSNLYLSVCTHW